MADKKSVTENFLTSNIFTFDSFSCDCESASVLKNVSDAVMPAIRFIPKPENKLRFAFGSKIGLVRLNDDGSIAENNLLGKLLSIESNCPEDFFPFFSRNGFFLPLNSEKPELISFEEIKSIVDRLRATLELVSVITSVSNTSYETMIRMIFYHLFAPIVLIEINNGKYKYSSTKHQYAMFLEEMKDAKREARLNDVFNNDAFVFNDTIETFSLDSEFVDSVLNGVPKETKYENALFQQVFTAYCSTRDEKKKTMLMINDFIFHYLYEVGIVEHVDLSQIYYVNNSVNKSRFSQKLKNRAAEISKYLLKEEIETNLRRVRPTYDITKLEPAWKIDSLLSALYFGLFYMKPNMETYRRCASPKCNEFFLVPLSSRKKKYCCTRCMNREMAARKRVRDKIADSKEL